MTESPLFSPNRPFITRINRWRWKCVPQAMNSTSPHLFIRILQSLNPAVRILMPVSAIPKMAGNPSPNASIPVLYGPA